MPLLAYPKCCWRDARDQNDSGIVSPLGRVSAAGKKLLRMINELLDLAENRVR